jgi:hypothetical protein
VLHPPISQLAGKARISVVIDYHHGRPAEVELLHGAEANSLKATNDDVTCRHRLRPLIHLSMLPSGMVVVVAGPLNLRDCPHGIERKVPIRVRLGTGLLIFAGGQISQKRVLMI